MQHKILSNSSGTRNHALIFQTGDEVLQMLTRFALEQGIHAASFTAIGAFERVTLGWFDWNRRDYKRIELHEQVEVLSLLGDISMEGTVPKVHAHVVVGTSEGDARGGHLLEGQERPTLELFLREVDAELRRAFDPLSRIPLIAL